MNKKYVLMICMVSMLSTIKMNAGGRGHFRNETGESVHVTVNTGRDKTFKHTFDVKPYEIKSFTGEQMTRECIKSILLRYTDKPEDTPVLYGLEHDDGCREYNFIIHKKDDVLTLDRYVAVSF
jgi:hypothetical protein